MPATHFPTSTEAPGHAPIQAVLFDYGLVLTGPPHPPAWQAMQRLLGAEEVPFHAAYWRFRHDYDRGALDGRTYWQEVAHELGRPPDPATTTQLIAADIELWTQPNQPMIDWAAALQRAGIRTGILSNLGDAMEAGVRTRFAWLDGFYHLTFSHRLGTAKPDSAIYQHAAQGLGVPPAQVLFIDDRLDNIEGARAAGMHAVQYTTQPEFVRALQEQGLGSLLAV